MKISIVKPVNQVSFYNKAIQIEIDDYIYLKSYDTIVGFIHDNEFYRCWGDYSATTMKHINSFLQNHDLPTYGKKEWEKLPVFNYPLTYMEEKEIAKQSPEFTVSQNIYFNPFLM